MTRFRRIIRNLAGVACTFSNGISGIWDSGEARARRREMGKATPVLAEKQIEALEILPLQEAQLHPTDLHHVRLLLLRRPLPDVPPRSRRRRRQIR